MRPSRKPVAAYVRMSTDHQKYSISNQLAVIEGFCTHNDMDLVQIYADAGKSGLTIEGRPGLCSLIADAKEGRLSAQAVLVLDVTRFGRFQNVDEGAYLEHLLKRAGAPVLYCAEAFDNDDLPGSAIIKAVKRAMAAEFSRELSVKTAAGARRVAQEGWRACGAAGFGFRRVIVSEEGKLLYSAERGEMKCLHRARTTLQLGPPEEVDAVRRMFELFVEKRLSIRDVCRTLIAERRPSPTPHGWSQSVVGDLLRNEKYMGDSIYGKRTGGLTTKRRDADPCNWVVVEKAFPPIISRSTFMKAQQLRLKNLHKHTSEQVLKGLWRLYHKRGSATRSLIDKAKFLPSSTHVCRMFGSLEQAYALAGLPKMTLSEKRSITRAAKLRSARLSQELA